MPMDKIRVLIVEDHPLMREALHDAVGRETGFEIVGEAASGRQAVELALSLKPQVVLMDLSLPGMGGIEATREILKAQPATRVLVLTSSNEDASVMAAIRAGALGYLTKDASLQQIRVGLREVADGRRFIPADIGEKLARAVQDEEVQNASPLTAREKDVLVLVGEGKTNLEIGMALQLSEGTVRVHISNIMHKLDLKNRSQVVAYANRRASGAPV